MEKFVNTRAALENLVDAVDGFAMKHSAVEAHGDQSTSEMRQDEWSAYMRLLEARTAANYFTRPVETPDPTLHDLKENNWSLDDGH